MAERVCIANADYREPIFHKIGTAERNRHGGFFFSTHCNVAIADQVYGIVSLRREHAERFAVACKRCFPGEAGRA